jgi:hypothetical protein
MTGGAFAGVRKKVSCHGRASRDRDSIAALKRDDFSSNRHRALSSDWSMIFSDLPSPVEASSQTTNRAMGFAQAGNRFPLFGIML